KSSKLIQANKFNKKDRVVKLEGEAFFDIAKNAEKPFIVQVDKIKVEVLGTSFNVKSYDSLTEVVVETGKVKVQTPKGSFTLLPKETILVNNNTYQITQSHISNQLYQYFRTNLFVCDNTPLNELIFALNKAYNVNIKIKN